MTDIYKDENNETKKKQTLRRRKYQLSILIYNSFKMYLISCCQFTNTVYVLD